MASRWALWPTLALVFPLFAAATSPAAAQTATASSLRSAFLFNFAKFTQWPAEALPPAAPLVICILGDPPVAAELEQSSRNQILEGHRIVVWKGLGEGPPQSCHVLYVAAALERQVQALLDTVRNAPVLTVGESALFAEAGGSVQLF